MTDTQKTHYADPDTLQRIMQMESQLRDLRRAIGIFDSRPHADAVAKAEALARDSDLFEWAEGQEMELREVESSLNPYRLIYYYPAGDGTILAEDFDGPYLRDVLRQAMEWEERER